MIRTEPPIIQGLPYLNWVIYRDGDGQVMQYMISQQITLDATQAILPAGFSIAIVPEATPLMAVVRYGFIDVDDPAKPLAFDADKLKADGVTLADILANRPETVGEHDWTTRPITKPTKAT